MEPELGHDAPEAEAGVLDNLERERERKHLTGRLRFKCSGELF